MKNPFTDEYGFNALGMITITVGGLAVFIAIFMVAGISLSRHFNRINCRQFAVQTHRPTKFVLYNKYSDGVCLTRSGNGTWIPIDNLREFGSR